MKAFGSESHVDPDGVEHTYCLAERGVRLKLPTRRAAPTSTPARKTVVLRQVTRRMPDGHQVVILTSRTDCPAAEVVYRMTNRWRMENYFKYGRGHFALDALDGYAVVADDLNRTVPNPKKNTARKRISLARSALARARADLAVAAGGARAGAGGSVDLTALSTAVAAAAETLEVERRAGWAVAARVPLAQVHPDSKLLDEERKLVTHAVRIAAYNSESALARLLRPHYSRAKDEARALLREAFTLSGDIQYSGGRLHLRLDPATAPRRSRAIAALCAELTATETVYPGTQMKIVYSVKGYPNPA